MADFFGAASDLIGGITDLFGGNAAAKGSKKAGEYYQKAADITKQSTALQELAVQRQTYQVLGQNKAAAAANGVMQGGSAADLLRSSAQQSAVTRALTAEQGEITEASYEGQAQSAFATAKAQKGGGIGGLLGGIIEGAGALFGI